MGINQKKFKMNRGERMINVDVLNNQDWKEFFETLHGSDKKYSSMIVVFEDKCYEVGIREIGWKRLYNEI